MIKVGVVIDANEDIVKVRVPRESACGGNCAHCNGCQGDETVVEAKNDLNLCEGDKVQVIMDDKKFLKSVVLGYGALVFAMVLGGVFGYVFFKDETTSVFGVVLCMGIMLVVLRCLFKNKAPDIKIERF